MEGFARNTATIQAWLDRCPAVLRWEEYSKEYLTFRYDPEIEVSIAPPGVWFEMDPDQGYGIQLERRGVISPEESDWIDE